MMNVRLLVFVIFLFLPFLVKGQTIVSLGNSDLVSLSSFSLIESKKIPFKTGADSSISGDFYQVTILDTSDADKSWIVEFVDFRIDEIEVYIPTKAGNGFNRYRTGDLYPFQSRAIRHKNFVFPLPLIKGKPYTIYIKTRKERTSSFVLKANIRSLINFAEYGFYEYAFLAFFYGMLFSMALYNLIRFLFTRDSIHALYVLYITGLTVFELTRIDGLGFQYIWPAFPGFNIYSLNVSLAAFVLLSALFTSAFLNIRHEHPRISVFIYCVISIRLLMLLALCFHWLVFDVKLIDVSILGLLAYIGLKKYSIRQASVRYYFYGYVCMFIGFCIYILQEYSLIAHSFLTYYSLNIGVLTETILISMAISEKTKQLLTDKQLVQSEVIYQLEENKQLQHQLIEEYKVNEELKDKINKELEEKVRERTTELEQKNEELKVQKSQIESMASQLDYQLFFLQQDAKTKRLESLWTKNISFEEFKTIYPDDISCLKYLEQLKWGDIAFRCRKCGHSKFLKNIRELSRKCTRCTYQESVMSGTLFHGIHFPVQKAFYLFHYCFHRSETMNVSKVSREIDLRLNTCRGFIGKIQERLDALKPIPNQTNEETMKQCILN